MQSNDSGSLPRSPGGAGSAPMRPNEVATYIATITSELRHLAARTDLGFLAYLLAMVSEDAAETARRLGR